MVNYNVGELLVDLMSRGELSPNGSLALADSIQFAMLVAAKEAFAEGYQAGYGDGWDSEHDKGEQPWLNSNSRAALQGDK